jgi:hypothetical protein
MSVRERLFLRTDRAPADFARLAGEVIGGRVETQSGESWLLVDTARLVPGVAGEFGGPVVAHESERPFRPDGEFEATDAYNVEMRLWQAQGPRLGGDSGLDVEAHAASAIFDALAKAIDVPMIQVRGDDKVVRAFFPGRGVQNFPPDTTVYDWDEPKWDGYVVLEA